MARSISFVRAAAGKAATSTGARSSARRLGPRDDVEVAHGTGLRLEDLGEDFHDAEVEIDGVPAPCKNELDRVVSCADIPGGARMLRIRNAKRNLRFVTVTSTDAECAATSRKVCPQ